MEGLIKGLLDVALGNDDDNDQRRNSPGSQNELPRSSWAQVVSGDDQPNPDVNYGQSWKAQEYERPHQSANRHSSKREDEGDESNDNWETGRKTSYRKPQRDEREESNDNWETVGRKPPRQKPQRVAMDHWSDYKRPPSEQEYYEEVQCGSEIEPTNQELHDLSAACNKLWEIDSNRLVPGQDYEIDCGEGKKAYQREDMAAASLFSWLKDDVFCKPTYSRFCSLLDNYNPNEGCKEVVTAQEKQEQVAFVEEISRTAPIKYLYKYLIAKGVISDGYEEFKRMMISLWFDLCNRGGTSGSSSAFEHVFVGEVKQRGEESVSGFHNWIQFYLEEAKGTVDYQGYVFPRRRGQIPDSETQILTIQFEWNGILKSVSSTMVGVSPEFEIALYTLCFFVGEEDNHVQVGPYPINIKCYHLGRDKIGSVFPIAES